MTAPPGPPRATEAQCQATVVAAAKAAGWLVHAERPALIRPGRHATPIQGHPGFPDLVLAHERHRRLLFIELKRRPNHVEPAQARWHLALAAAGASTAVWWVPEDLPDLLDLITHPERQP